MSRRLTGNAEVAPNDEIAAQLGLTGGRSGTYVQVAALRAIRKLWQAGVDRRIREKMLENFVIRRENERPNRTDSND